MDEACCHVTGDVVVDDDCTDLFDETIGAAVAGDDDGAIAREFGDRTLTGETAACEGAESGITAEEEGIFDIDLETGILELPDGTIEEEVEVIDNGADDANTVVGTGDIEDDDDCSF